MPTSSRSNKPKRRVSKKTSPVKRKSSGKKSPVKRKSSGKKSPVKRKSSGKNSPVKRKSLGKNSPVKRKSSGKKSPVTRRMTPKKKITSRRKSPNSRRVTPRDSNGRFVSSQNAKTAMYAKLKDLDTQSNTDRPVFPPPRVVPEKRVPFQNMQYDSPGLFSNSKLFPNRVPFEDMQITRRQYTPSTSTRSPSSSPRDVPENRVVPFQTGSPGLLNNRDLFPRVPFEDMQITRRQYTPSTSTRSPSSPSPSPSTSTQAMQAIQGASFEDMRVALNSSQTGAVPDDTGYMTVAGSSAPFQLQQPSETPRKTKRELWLERYGAPAPTQPAATRPAPTQPAATRRTSNRKRNPTDRYIPPPF